MHRISPFRILIVLTAVLVLLSGGPGVAAQDADTANHPIVGTWEVSLGDDPHVHGLLTHHADGTMTSTDPITMVAPPGSPVSVLYPSGAFGVWEATGPNTIAYTYRQFNSDADGNLIAIVTISGVREVSADGQTFTGHGTVQVADPEGNVFFSEPTPEVRGQRLVVMPIEPVGTPAASPEAGATGNAPLSINGVVVE
jgi:hypothetical protein